VAALLSLSFMRATSAAAPNTVRQAAGSNIGKMVLLVEVAIHGIRFWPQKPPKLPIELIAARLAAARAPLKKRGGSDQKHG